MRTYGDPMENVPCLVELLCMEKNVVEDGSKCKFASK